MKNILHQFKVKRHQWLQGFLIGFIISLSMFLLSILGHFRPFENPVTSTLQQLSTKQSNDVALIFITKKDYQQEFNSTSPLDRTKLAEIVETLAILGAKVIALDFDLSGKFSEFENGLDLSIAGRESTVPIVIPSMLRPIVKSDLNGSSPSYTRPYLPTEYIRNERGYIQYSLPAIGFSSNQNSDTGKQNRIKVMHGGINVTLDRDSILRRGQAFYALEGTNNYIPSFPLVIACAYHGKTQEDIEKNLKAEPIKNKELKESTLSNICSDGKSKMNLHYDNQGKITPKFYGDYSFFPYEVSLSQFLETYSGVKSETQTIFKDKVVIVGGVYDDKDFYNTPIGRMSGMEVIANFTQSILDDTLITHVHKILALIIEIGLGAVAAFTFIIMKPGRAFLFCCVSLIPFSAIASLTVYSGIYYWIDFVPTVAGVMVHGVVSKIEEKTHS